MVKDMILTYQGGFLWESKIKYFENWVQYESSSLSSSLLSPLQFSMLWITELEMQSPLEQVVFY
jgi:hypothetical protein